MKIIKAYSIEKDLVDFIEKKAKKENRSISNVVENAIISLQKKGEK
jgi:hypothetical protein